MTKKKETHNKYYYEVGRNGWNATTTLDDFKEPIVEHDGMKYNPETLEDKHKVHNPIKETDKAEVQGYIEEMEKYVNDMENYIIDNTPPPLEGLITNLQAQSPVEKLEDEEFKEILTKKIDELENNELDSYLLSLRRNEKGIPEYYKGANGYEARKVCDNFELTYHIGTAVTYLIRAYRKHKTPVSNSPNHQP